MESNSRAGFVHCSEVSAPDAQLIECSESNPFPDGRPDTMCNSFCFSLVAFADPGAYGLGLLCAQVAAKLVAAQDPSITLVPRGNIHVRFFPNGTPRSPS
jgi:hypothetical protein